MSLQSSARCLTLLQMKAFCWAAGSMISAFVFASPLFAQSAPAGRIIGITVDPSDPTGNTAVEQTSVRLSSGGSAFFVKRNAFSGPVARVEVRLGKVRYSASLRSGKNAKWKKRFKLDEGKTVIRVRIVGQDGSARQIKKVVFLRPVN